MTVFPRATSSRMFPFVTCTWNPLGGECLHKCTYCWARKLAADRKMAKYQGKPYLVEKERRFKPDDFVFVCDMCDLFGDWVPDDFVEKIWSHAIRSQPTKFLFLTKNPNRYYARGFAPENLVLGCTIESNRDTLVSFAPRQTLRLKWMNRLEWDSVMSHIPRFISVEPILNFDVEEFSEAIIHVKPWAVAVGYDNYKNHLPEPPLAKTMQLIEALEKAGIKVYRKTLREAWNVNK